MHTSTSARTVAMVLIAVLCGTVLALADRGPAAAAARGPAAGAAARHCTGIESDSSVTAEKVIEVKQRSTITADIYLCSKSDGRYVRDQGPYRARLGYNGTTADKREGDGKTPQG